MNEPNWFGVMRKTGCRRTPIGISTSIPNASMVKKCAFVLLLELLVSPSGNSSVSPMPMVITRSVLAELIRASASKPSAGSAPVRNSKLVSSTLNSSRT